MPNLLSASRKFNPLPQDDVEASGVVIEQRVSGEAVDFVDEEAAATVFETAVVPVEEEVAIAQDETGDPIGVASAEEPLAAETMDGSIEEPAVAVAVEVPAAVVDEVNVEPAVEVELGAFSCGDDVDILSLPGTCLDLAH